MSETIQVGSVVTGKVTGIQPYGAFVALDEQTQGLVHISEITHGYVKNINDYLKVGDEVNVKILSVDKEAGKIGLSIRATEAPPVEQAEQQSKQKKQKKRPITNTNFPSEGEITEGFNTLKEKLSEWIDQSQREDLINK
ncbi:S1 domain-containing post-transcriptional regulator GSP13 [Bacillus marasmi]|uniref:S1 domain-containing post-transcriptional regulator GSP13 n=1 Tax=Bacillus marasmi TaxID=1926279 RepID=UPI0011C82BE8|nr:S1 domain-containing post-transcriptional regulator GSP13 [Bacillus marasmi]